MNGEWWHGTFSGYAHYGCRCTRCTEANRLQCASTRAKLRQRPRSDVPHGEGGYTNWGCRCPICSQAHSEKQAQYQAKRKATAGLAEVPS